MKTFAKKSLSVVLAMLMALSALTVGSMSAFAATNDKPYTDYAVTDASADSVFNFVAPKTGCYTVMVTAGQKDVSKDADKASASFSVYTVDEKDATKFDEKIASDWTYNEMAYRVDNSVPGQSLLVKSDLCVPATDRVRLVKGETYKIVVSADNYNTLAYVVVRQGDFTFSVSTETEDLSYNAEYVNRYDYVSDTYKEKLVKYDKMYIEEDAVIGLQANVNGYYGAATAVTVPSQFEGIAVKSVYPAFTPVTLAKRITSVAIPEGVKSIGGMDGFYALSSVNFPSTLEYIGEGAFSGCHALGGRITLPASVEYVGGFAFFDTAVTAVEIPNVNAAVGDKAFGYKEVLNDATSDPRDTIDVKVDNFFVIAPAASLVTKYAADNGFVAYDRANCLANNHPFAMNDVKAATVFANGYKKGVCPVCGAKTKTVLKKKTFKLSYLKSKKKNSFIVKAPAQKEMKGYVVEYSTSKKFSKKTTKKLKVKTTKSLNKTIKGLKSGKKYYVRVRAFKTSGKKTIYSKYTSVKSVKVK